LANNRTSVPASVESIVTRNQAIHTCLKLRIVNYHALASILKFEVEKITGKPTTINTLVVAIKRFSDTLVYENKKMPAPLTSLRDATLTLTSDVAEVTLRPKKAEFLSVLKKIVEVSSRMDEAPDLFKSANLIKLVAGEKEYRSVIRTELEKSIIEKEFMGLSKLSLRLSPMARRDAGFDLFISELLYRNGIEAVHSYIDEDTIILVNKSDAPRAFEILDQEILRTKQVVPIPRLKSRTKVLHERN
jgi:hypothetical protein